MQCWARAEGGEALYLFYSLSSIIREEEAPPAGCHTTSDARTRVGSSSERGRKHLEHRGSGLHHVRAGDIVCGVGRGKETLMADVRRITGYAGYKPTYLQEL